MIRIKSNSSVLYFGILLFLFALLTGCIDLAPSKSLAQQKGYQFLSRAQVFVMRGGLGGVFSTGMNQLQKTLERQYRIKTESTVWYKAEALSRDIITHYGKKSLPGPIILVGHSLGANEQIKVARNLEKFHIPVALIITIDAVSPLAVPSNVKKIVNIYKPGYVPLFSGQLIKVIDAKKTQLENIHVTDIKTNTVNHFTIDKNSAIQQLMVEEVLAAVRHSKSPLLNQH